MLFFLSRHNILKFLQLERLILDNYLCKIYLNTMDNYLIYLSKLYASVLILVDCVQNTNNLFLLIYFVLLKLKYCTVTYRIKEYLKLLPIDFNKYEHNSSIKHLVINSRFRFNSFNNLL
ncbi:unnamed protein product [Rotaria sordida]|uniref:Uncharacterized protein n=1 Tax=Rotaria sordida TaxID=392033 RepID=A0A819QVU0_9BILA|nr:unnamed protein product [Rotaria sordida]CAF4037924.1 unnamed protein product [Rotaria sordida]